MLDGKTVEDNWWANGHQMLGGNMGDQSESDISNRARDAGGHPPWGVGPHIHNAHHVHVNKSMCILPEVGCHIR